MNTTKELTISTYGETIDWLENEVTGDSPTSQAWIDQMRILIADVQYQPTSKEARSEEVRATERAALAVTGILGRKSEERFQAQTMADPERILTDADILTVETMVNPDHPNFAGYIEAEDMLKVCQTVDELAAQQVAATT